MRLLVEAGGIEPHALHVRRMRVGRPWQWPLIPPTVPPRENGITLRQRGRYLDRDPKPTEDVDSSGPDHAADAVRYGCLHERATMRLEVGGHKSTALVASILTRSGGSVESSEAFAGIGLARQSTRLPRAYAVFF